MKKLIPALLLCVLGCLAGEPMIRLDFAKAQGNMVPNSGTGDYTAQIDGKFQIDGGVLKMDGLTTKVTVKGTESLDVSKNYTFMLLYRRDDLPGNDTLNLAMDTFFAKSKVFVMNKYHTNFYANARFNNKWDIDGRKSGVFKQEDKEWHHVAMSLEYRLNWNDAEEWVEYTFYKDGANCGRIRVKDVRIEKNDNLLEIGFNSAMGKPWMLGGEIADARVYEGILSEAEIREIVLAQKLAKPGFKVEYVLTAEEEQALKAKKLSPEYESAIRNLASMETQRVDWRGVMARPEASLSLLPGKESRLTLVTADGYAAVCSWYDVKAGRELLKGDHAFVGWTLEQWQLEGGKAKGSRLLTFEPYSEVVKSSLVGAPQRDQDGTWRFAIQYECAKPHFSAVTDFVFADDRLEYSHRAKSLEEGVTVHSVGYPKCAFRQLAGEGEEMVVPEGCGVVYRHPCKGNVHFANPYPRSMATMQFGMYYDKLGGVYIATQDPWARRKEMDFTGSEGRLEASFTWRVPYDAPGKPNVFDTGCSVALELFRGDWYDGGLLYKRDVARMKADWWLPSLPRTTSRKDLMENCLWVNASYTGMHYDLIYEFKKYLGQDLYVGDVWKWWERGICTHLAPTMRAKPEWIEFVKALKAHGISTMPYIDGRLWAERDRRGEDWMYSDFGHKMNIVSDGVPIREMYANPCDVVCPATKEYQEHFFEFIKTITMQGLNGLYIDQLGASFPPPCHVAEHGHPYADWFTSYRNGYAKLLRRLREYWAGKGKEMVLSTEDGVEPFCVLLDLCQPYRWIYENQIPLFPLVYSGRIQFYNRTAQNKDARFQTTAEQLLNSEQIGIFGNGELTSVFNDDLRRYAKRLAWTRHALLDFFNAGQMARPPVMKGPMPKVQRYWGQFGTRFVTKPQVQCAAWDYGSTRVVILINTEGTAHANTVRFELPAGDCEYEILSCEAETVRGKAAGKTAEIAFDLKPRMPQLIVAYPVGRRDAALLEKMEADFRIVRGTLTEPDPFGCLILKDTEPIDGSKGDNLINSCYITGCRPSQEFGRIDYIANAVIYPGVVEFGEGGKSEIVMEVACATAMGGCVKIYLDGVKEENLIGEIPLALNFRTKSWNDFEELRGKFKQKVTGRHKLVVAVPGNGLCNLRKWRLE